MDIIERGMMIQTKQDLKLLLPLFDAVVNHWNGWQAAVIDLKKWDVHHPGYHEAFASTMQMRDCYLDSRNQANKTLREIISRNAAPAEVRQYLIVLDMMGIKLLVVIWPTWRLRLNSFICEIIRVEKAQ